MTPRTCLCLSEADRFESEGFTLTAEHLRIQCAGDKSHNYRRHVRPTEPTEGAPMSEQATARRHYHDEMAVDVPEGASGDVRVERFTIEPHSFENIRQAFSGRGTQPGSYTRLTRGGQLWMSDTDAERRDHLDPACQIAHGAESVLIGGLGLGMILRVALLTPTVERVDVVEIDPDVLALVGPHYAKMAAEAGIQLVLHQADIFTIKWRPGTRWDVAWFDVWPELSTDELVEMSKLRRSYGRRTGWNDCWGRHHLLRQRAHDSRWPW